MNSSTGCGLRLPALRPGSPPMALLGDHRLNVYLFASVTGDAAEAASGLLEQVYAGCVSGLGLDDGIEHLPGEPPQTLGGAGGVLTGRRGHGPATRELLLLVDDDVACVCVTLSRAGLPDAGWPDLLTEWSAAASAAAADTLLGVAFVYQALTDTRAVDATDTDLTEAISTQLPVQPARGWERTGAGLRPRGGKTGDSHPLVLWQVDAVHCADATQQVVVVGGADADDDLGEAVWNGSWRGGNLPTLPRYLLDAAKLRYQARVLGRDRDGLRQQRHAAGRTLERLRPVLTGPADASSEQLIAAQNQLAQLQANEAGLIDSLIAARTMRRSVAIAAANMAAVRAELAHGDADPDAGVNLFDQYQADAELLEQQLDDEALFLQSAAERAQFFAAAADRELTRRSERDAETDRRREERFSLTQTAFLGTVVTALTAVQAFNYTIPVPEPAKPAWIATLGAAAFWLASIAVRLAHQRREPHGHGGRPRDLLEITACASFGASLGWVTAVTLTTTPTALVTVRVAVAGGVLGALGSAVAAWRRAKQQAAQRSKRREPGTAGPA